MEHKMISSYWNSSYLKVVSPGGCIPRRSSSLEVVFHIFKMFKIILRCSGVDLQILQSKFSWFPAISLLVWMVVAQDMWRWRRRICGGRAAGEINNKANSAQLSYDWGWAWQYWYELSKTMKWIVSKSVKSPQILALLNQHIFDIWQIWTINVADYVSFNFINLTELDPHFES